MTELKHLLLFLGLMRIDDSKKSFYYADIETVVDSGFHLSYRFKNDAKIYDGDITSFYPHAERVSLHFIILTEKYIVRIVLKTEL
ncbi:hypothetical protein OAA06_00180 [bacterium]|nr:hypothetical protein [bacterium]